MSAAEKKLKRKIKILQKRLDGLEARMTSVEDFDVVDLETEHDIVGVSDEIQMKLSQHDRKNQEMRIAALNRAQMLGSIKSYEKVVGFTPNAD